MLAGALRYGCLAKAGNERMKWMRIAGTIVLAWASVWPYALSAASAPARVYSDAGNIFVERDGRTTKLTSSEMDVDPVLAPTGKFVVYTRLGRGRNIRGYEVDCITDPKPDELRQINIDGGGDRILLSGRAGDPDERLCDFRDKQFSSDGRRLYFLTPGWTTSGALHVLDMRSGDEHFVLPANDVLVLNFCSGKYKDHLAVLSHRYFLFGGSYDWYWLYDPSGKKQLGPLGEFDNPDDMLRQAHRTWCEGKS
jgi:hypothetical protein